jgi:hypothetical protein
MNSSYLTATWQGSEMAVEGPCAYVVTQFAGVGSALECYMASIGAI